MSCSNLLVVSKIVVKFLPSCDGHFLLAVMYTRQFVEGRGKARGRNFETETRWQFMAIVILVNIVCIPYYQLSQRHACIHRYTLIAYLTLNTVKWSGGLLAWLSAMGCRLAYSPADATATHYLLLQ